MDATPLLEMQGITVRFGAVLANDQIDLKVQPGEIRALLGENGAGKTTLMKTLAGLVQPSSGQIYLHGRPVQIPSAVAAMQLGIGMVHQHFMLIPTLTVTQNICIGLRRVGFPFPRLRRVAAEIRELAQRYQLQVDPNKPVAQLSVGEQQRVEIIKALYRGAQLLILDEPTSVLTPQETENLFGVLRNLAQEGKAVLFISHKLNEVMRISHQITVLRQGQVVATCRTAETTTEGLAQLMVGRQVHLPALEQPNLPDQPPVLTIRNLRYQDARGLAILRELSLVVRQGEIHGLAGVDGNGQGELARLLAGLLPATGGAIFLNDHEITRASPAERIKAGLAHIPGDRQQTGLVMDLSVADNCLLELHNRTPYAKLGFRNFGQSQQLAEQLIQEYAIRCHAAEQPVATLSGGNQQKVVLARELVRKPAFIVAVQPTRGLDVSAIEFVYTMLLAQRQRGCAILLISTELDEIMTLADRISVIYEGQIVDTVARTAADREMIGLLMAGKRPVGRSA